MQRGSKNEVDVEIVGAIKVQAAVDVVFLHGIGGHPYSTWTGGSSDGTDFWPSLIDAAAPQAQVWTANYPAHIQAWFGASFPLRANAMALLDRLSQRIGNRPIIFVCHSLGGLVAKQIFRTAVGPNAAPNLQKIGTSIAGFVFLGTPHLGSSLASLANALIKGLGLSERLTGFTQSANELAKENSYLEELSDWFRSIVASRKVSVLAYSETQPTKGLMVVEAYSANPTVVDVRQIPLPMNHLQLAGPHKRGDQIFDGVLNLIHSVANQAVTPIPAASGFSMDIGVIQSDIESWSRTPEDPVIYSVRRSTSETRITFELAYLDLFRAGGPIRDVNYLTGTRCPFLWDYPTLDLKFINNTAETIYLTEVAIEVEESAPIMEPLFAIRRDVQQRHAGQLILINEGWKAISELTLNFNITPGRVTELLPNSPPYAHSIHQADLIDRAELDVTSAFGEAGVGIEDLIGITNGTWTEDGLFELPEGFGEKRILTEAEMKALETKALGAYKDWVGTLAGEIRYRAGAEAAVRTVKFQTFVYLANQNRMGMRRPSSFQYEARLEVEAGNYTRYVPLSQELKSGDTDRFALKLAASQSSRHRFRLIFRDASGKVFPSGVVILDCFVPRSRAESAIQLQVKGPAR